MIVYGFAKDTYYTNDGVLMIKVRIPNIHGANDQKSYKGARIRNWTAEADLPYYPSVLLPHLPNYDEVVVLSSMNEDTSEFIVLGLSGGFYNSVSTDYV